MYIQNTGKALALSVFLHSLVLIVLLMTFDTSKQIDLGKKIDNSTEKSALSVTYVTVSPEQVKVNEISSPTSNLVSKQRNSVELIKPTQKTIYSS